VVGVRDGDTITVLDQNKRQHKVRLIGIDAPESKQDFGEVTKQNLSSLVFGKEVTVISKKRDQYGRLASVLCVVPSGASGGCESANVRQLSP
jgi:endonuclease YncB( thermonuclease family)